MTARIFPGQNSSLRLLLLKNLSVSALIFALLEFWRPLYFLTDDNLGGAFPQLTEIGQRLAGGKSPFISGYIFNGNYNLLRDASSCWHPIYLLASLLANTPAHFLIVDAAAFSLFMLATAGFVHLAHFLRSELDLKLSDARLMLYSLSFTYSMIVLTTGSSWVTFLGNHSALPWLALGILQTSWRKGLGLVTLFSIHHILGGYLAATISDSIFFSLFAAGVAFTRRSLIPLFSWTAGFGVAILVLVPLLVPAGQGFLDADRAEGLTAAKMSQFAVPASLLPLSYFFGVFSSLLPMRMGFGACQVYYSSAFVSCAAAWALVPAMLSRARWRPLEMLCLGLVAILTVMVIRPLWISEIMIHLPVLKSMRWPFREILQLQFFLHLFLVLRPLGGTVPFQRKITAISIFIFLFPWLFLPAPTFYGMHMDRQLLFSGRANRYWDRVKTLLGPDDCLVPVADPALINNRNYQLEIPFTLLGAYDFPILFKVKSATGYSIVAPRDQLYLHTAPAINIGIFSPDQKQAILQERPGVRFITLESVEPLRITLSTPNRPPIDLTPYIPPE